MTPAPRSRLLGLLSARGHVHQTSDFVALDALAQAKEADGEGLAAYIGFDCTAPSLHVGNLAGIMALRRLQQAGHRPIVLLGGGTTRVGDPSGRDTTRTMLDDAAISENMAGIRKILRHFITEEGPHGAIFVDNAAWLNPLNLLDFLRDTGKHFSINRMLTMDSVRARLERDSHLSLLEFMYMALQAYDFVELRRRHGCVLQLGGSDQWGNIVMGIELARRVGEGGLFGLTWPLLTTASGAKMGKTAAGAVWLDGAMLAPEDYWNWWRDCDDRDIRKLLALFTELPDAAIADLGARTGADSNHAKEALADAATALAHGEDVMLGARAQARRCEVSPQALAQGLGILDALRLAGLTETNGQGRRAMAQNAVMVNGARETSPTRRLTLDDFSQGEAELAIGRKRRARLVAAAR